MPTHLILHQDVIRGIGKGPRVTRYLRRIAQAGCDGTRRRCPVDTGRLRDSYVVQWGPGWARWGTDVPYAPHVEYGTWFMRAQPHLRPGIADAIREAFRVF